MKTYVGIADAHGVESFMDGGEGGKVPMVLSLRASTNRQRHAVVYIVELDNEGRSEVEGLIARQDFKGALLFLKAQPSFAVEKQFERSGQMIPNDALDPYWSE